MIGPKSPELGSEHPLEIRRACPLPTGFDVVKVPKEHMSQGSCQAHVRGNEIHDVGASEIWDPSCFELSVVDLKFVVQYETLIPDVVACEIGRAIKQFL